MLTLSVQNLSYGYTALPLFENLSFQVSAGEILHLKGPNGAGKSTLMQVLAGLIKPKSGDILWRHGKMVVDNPASYREYLPAEANGLYGKLDAMANLAFWLRLRGRIATEKELIGALEQWNLAHPLLRMNFPVEKFSTGMKRRLALARVNLASVPGWLLDEPLYGLDDNGVATLRRALRAHCEDGGLAVVVSHDMEALQGLPVRTLTLGAVA